MLISVDLRPICYTSAVFHQRKADEGFISSLRLLLFELGRATSLRCCPQKRAQVSLLRIKCTQSCSEEAAERFVCSSKRSDGHMAVLCLVLVGLATFNKGHRACQGSLVGLSPPEPLLATGLCRCGKIRKRLPEFRRKVWQHQFSEPEGMKGCGGCS